MFMDVYVYVMYAKGNMKEKKKKILFSSMKRNVCFMKICNTVKIVFLFMF